MTEEQRLMKEIEKLEAAIEPKRKRLNEIWSKQHENTAERVKRCNTGKDKFELDELIFSSHARCDCGAGMAYPENIGTHGSWYCSDILLGRAAKKNEPDSKNHTGALPFTFYQINSEKQPSVNGATTRPAA